MVLNYIQNANQTVKHTQHKKHDIKRKEKKQHKRHEKKKLVKRLHTNTEAMVDDTSFNH